MYRLCGFEGARDIDVLLCAELSRALYMPPAYPKQEDIAMSFMKVVSLKKKNSKLSVVFLKIVQFLQDLVQRMFVIFSSELVCYIYDDRNDYKFEI